MIDPIIAFYLDFRSIKEQIGFTYWDVMGFDGNTFEGCHNHIQWLFPLKEPSQFNPNAPLVTAETLNFFMESPHIPWQMDAAFKKYLSLYFMSGMGYDTWVTPNNHNFLRITRILKSQRLFGLDSNADILYNDYLEPICKNPRYNKIIGETTQKFWKEAYETPPRG